MERETMCIQAGYSPKNGESRMIPIIQSTTFKYDTSEDMGKLFDLEASGYFYTRLQNPTNDMVAAKIAALEGGTAGMLTSSGQAANFFSVFNIATCGDHVVCASTIYGGTFNLFNVTMRKMGIDFTFVDPDCSDEELENAFKYEGLGDIQNICIQLNNAIHKNSCSYIPVETYVKQHKTTSKAFDPYPKDNATSIPLWVVRGSISWDIDEPEEGFYSEFKLNESEELTDQDKELNQELLRLCRDSEVC